MGSLSLSSLPHEILMLIATSPHDLCLLAQTCKTLNEVASDDRVWKPIFMQYRKYAYTKRDGVSWKAATLGINHVRYALEHVFSQIAARSSIRTRLSFQKGVDPDHLKSLEEKNGISLPQYLKEYFMIANGQGPLPFGEGFLWGARLLSIEEALTEYNLRKTKGQILSDACFIYPYTRPNKISSDSAIGIPLTAEQGSNLTVASEISGAIYLESGWNVFNKAANWCHYLYDFMGIHVSSTYT